MAKNMSKNKNMMPRIAELLGVKLSERFTVERYNERFECRILGYGLEILSNNYENPYVDLSPYLLNEILNGTAVIVDEY